MVRSGSGLRASGFGALLVLGACGSGKPKPVEDGKATVPPPVTKPVVAGDAAPAPVGGAGDVSVRVEWHDVPIEMRQSPTRTPCGTAQVPAVAPTTTWGIPDAFVILSGTRKAPDAIVHVVDDRCTLSPRAVVAGGKLAVTSTASQPVSLAVHRAIAIDDLGKPSTDAARPLELPIAGHDVELALDAGFVYELAGGAGEDAFVLAAPTRWAAVTDAAGIATLRDLPAGKYEVTAWLPPHAHQPARLAHGDVTVTAGALAEVTLDLGK